MSVPLVFENHCRTSYERLLSQQPQVRTEGLWRTADRFFAVCPDLVDTKAHDGTPLLDWFNMSARIMGAPIVIVDKIPEGSSPVQPRSADEIARARGDAVTLREATADLALSLPPTFPEFALSDGGPPTTFTIRIPRKLSEDEERAFRDAYQSLGISESCDIEVVPSIDIPQAFRRGLPGDVDLLPSKFLPKSLAPAVRWLVETDEEQWLKARVDLFSSATKSPLTYLPEPFRTKVSRCLVDASVFPPANIRSYLPLYQETLIGMPFAQSYERALSFFGVTERDLVELAVGGHIRFILPQAIDRYPPSLVNSLAEQAPGALLLSRGLAAATVAETRRRIPLLFPPIGISERHEVLAALYQRISSDQTKSQLAKAIYDGLRDAWDDCDSAVARRGAYGVASCGAARMIIGAVRALSGRDLTLEIGHAVGICGVGRGAQDSGLSCRN